MQAVRDHSHVTSCASSDGRGSVPLEGDPTERQSRRRSVFQKSSSPTTFEIRGVTIHFPFQPYACQVTYMTSVIAALQQSENALLESPTGTGKTLCLLCACLGYQQHQRQVQRNAKSELTVNSDTATKEVATTSKKNVESSQATVSSPTKKDSPSLPGPPTIIYASRTHSQLSQVVRELRNTRYRPKHAVLGSREQMCIHPKVNPSSTNAPRGGSNIAPPSATDINNQCNKLGKVRKCKYRNNLDGFMAPSNEPSNQQQQSVRDMEDLIAMGKEHGICPFYYTRALLDPGVEIVFVPYNYLFDRDSRETTLAQIPWSNAVVIFDEAHNLESFASESASFDLTNAHIAGCIAEISKTIHCIQQVPDLNFNTSLKLDNLVRLKAIFLRLEQYILNLGPQTAYPGEFIMDIFQKGCGITYANHEIFIDEVKKVNDFLMDMRSGSGGNSSSGAPKLEHFVHCLKRVFGNGLESRCIAKAAFYRVHVSPKTTMPAPSTSTSGVIGRTISYWCFAPSLAMEELVGLNIRSIIVTSGTLSPLPSYSMELGLNFPHTLENPHIISSQQIHVRVIGKGVSGKLLNSSYERRQDNDYYLELGNTLVTLAKIIPDGMLLFFPSYSVMESCIEAWGGPASSRSNYNSNTKNDYFAKKRKISSKPSFSFPFVPVHFASDGATLHTSSPWKRLLATKAVVVEPKSTSDLPEALEDFHRYLGMTTSSGCVLMGVCRGKISEGIDFTNEQSRAVIITGLPFPPSHDTKVRMKREFLDNIRIQSSKKASGLGGFALSGSKGMTDDKLSGNEWYTQQAHRAVNQAIGRVIRNQKDYGAVLLLDSRFDQPQNHQGLSKWLRPHIRKDEGFGTAIRSLADFYKTAAAYTKVEEANARKALDAAKPILEYEDSIADDHLVSKITIVRRSNDGTGSEQDNAVYVDPNDVVARVDVKDLLQSKAEKTRNDEICHPNIPALKNYDALFNLKVQSSIVSISDKSKSSAARFMQAIKEKVEASNQSKFQKAIVAMKLSGERNDQQSYLTSAKGLVSLILGCEVFEESSFVSGSSMLYLFFTLLPRQNRRRVEVMSFEQVFNSSVLFSLLDASLGNEKLNALSSAMGRLLQALWSHSSGKPWPIEVYLREAKIVLNLIDSNQKLKAYLRLIPSRFHMTTRTWANEMEASRNIQKLKDQDQKNVGEVTVNPARFRMSDPTTRPTISQSDSAIIKRKHEEPFVPTSSKSTNNPYSKPAPSVLATKALNIGKTSQSTTVKAGEVLESFVATAASDVYVKPSLVLATRNIKTNAPRDLVCAVCSESCREPFMAECGHIACLSCWLGWLARSKTCMTCRLSTSKESLSRVVFERTPGEMRNSNPTLTQLCEENDSDDELEIS
jgi:regulator of telomere elongation helicase 1